MPNRKDTEIIYKEIPLTGRLRTAHDPATLEDSDFRGFTNMRYTDTTPEGILGQTKINTTAVSGTMDNLFHFRKDSPRESHLIAEADGEVYDNTTSIPGQGDFGSSIYSDPAGASVGRYALAPSGPLARTTGSESLLFGGTQFRCAGFVDNPTDGEIFDYTSIIGNTKTDAQNIAIIHTNLVGADYIATFYVGSILPIKGFYVDINTANTAAATTMAVKDWDGSAWQSVTTLVDGTTAGGVSFAQDGWVRFDSTVSTCKQRFINKGLAFWYQVTLTSTTDFDGVPKVNTVYVDMPMQKIQDLWDGEKVRLPCFALYDSGVYKDYTGNIAEDYYDSTVANTSVDVSVAWGPSEYWLIGSVRRLRGITISVAPTLENVTASVMTSNYWDGDSWVAHTGLDDGTSVGGVTIGQSGWVTWTAPSANVEMKYNTLPSHETMVSGITGESLPLSFDGLLYYYRINFDAQLTSGAKIFHVQGIPVEEEVSGYSFPLQHAGRLFLFDEVSGKRNTGRYSAFKSANVFNGRDSGIEEFGGDDPPIAGASLYSRHGSTISDHLIVCKKSETYLLVGKTPEEFKSYLIDNAIGCIAPRTMQPVGLPGKSAIPLAQTSAIWLSARGVEMYENGTVREISDDIADIFDQNHANYIGENVLPTCTSFYDQIRYEYHLIIPGVGEWVYDVKRGKWGNPDRKSGAYLAGGTMVQDTNGISYPYGFLSSGYVMRLENGTNFATDSGTNDIDHTLWMPDMALHGGNLHIRTELKSIRLIGKAKETTANEITVSHFGDSSTTASTPAIATISMSNVGKRLFNVIRAVGKIPFNHVLHSPKFEVSTNDETSGFGPIYAVIGYKVLGDDVR